MILSKIQEHSLLYVPLVTEQKLQESSLGCSYLYKH
jgi:hypothetical protein